MNSYPRELRVDFSKLRTDTLKRYAWFFKLESNRNARPELASTCAKHFMSNLEVNENHVLSNFENYIVNPNAAKTAPGTSNGANGGPSNKRPLDPSGDHSEEPGPKRKKAVIAEGRLVAARVNDNYILARVIKYLKRKRTYRVEDADEMTRERLTYELPQDYVLALPTEEEVAARRSFPKGARVLARFPKTSTFYPATVVKRADKQRYSLRFDDDEKGPDGSVRIMKVNTVEVVTERGM
mmetsp:Transcript_14215/g.25467  ORF Transcript_14215/g.25467 Transcript_14215/m.25467 type:complete len:239 (+) Transcript_14215:650-1366(+)|eukprot:CAMPEP_0184518856 /NCGR_PEP_ID=MMETSP0198_2-20121128/6306_1 /TAXON_ID=1112570 /ORGANISM="Thraustochytrium sp., Strain LLF1b" /LENGTH=238 /DNA_ID=CAMNT_0026909313 /DNA_START=511 /DNA_END=1227 /DNA_ORIENTATION=+